MTIKVWLGTTNITLLDFEVKMVCKITKCIIYIFLINLISGCTASKNIESTFKLDESVVERRNLQSHTFTIESKKIFFETIMAVLQDMGYIITETNIKSNILTASKRAMLSEQESLKLFNGFVSPVFYDVTLSLTLQPSGTDEKKITARLVANQQVWAISGWSHGFVKYNGTTIEDSLYSDFFSVVEKALFIENQTI
jgi:low affinity Fe/Cu permease